MVLILETTDVYLTPESPAVSQEPFDKQDDEAPLPTLLEVQALVAQLECLT